jgi:hypothetical protein
MEQGRIETWVHLQTYILQIFFQCLFSAGKEKLMF